MFTLAPAFVSIILYSLMSVFSTILYSILLISINLLLKKEFNRNSHRQLVLELMLVAVVVSVEWVGGEQQELHTQSLIRLYSIA